MTSAASPAAIAAAAATAKAAPPTPGGIEFEFIQLYQLVSEYSMVDWQRAYSVYSSVRYVLDAGIPGDFAECGVWKGGACMLMALTLLRHGATDRMIYLFDTFAGMAPPTAADVSMDGKKQAAALWEQRQAGDHNEWCYAGVEEVRANLARTGYPPKYLRFVRGRVEETLPAAAPARLALLRLDTDWYQSTYHELTHLYPRLSPGGVLILDDYSYWQGQKIATDQYFAEQHEVMLLHRIMTSAVGIKRG